MIGNVACRIGLFFAPITPARWQYKFTILCDTLFAIARHRPSQVATLMISGATGATQECDFCDSRSTTKSHPPRFLTDFWSENVNQTWWQSTTMLQGVHLQAINLTLDLHKTFELTYIRLRCSALEYSWRLQYLAELNNTWLLSEKWGMSRGQRRI